MYDDSVDQNQVNKKEFTKMKIGICGAGSWAIALAVLLRGRGHSLTMWEFSKKDADMLQNDRTHPVKLPGVIIPDDIRISNNIADAVTDVELVILAVPSQTMRSTLTTLAKIVDSKTLDTIKGWIIVSKGIEINTLKLMTDLTVELIPGVTLDKVVVLSGPSHAEEVARNVPTTVVAASVNQELALLVQSEFSTEAFRIYTHHDVRGVELAASVKNVIALAAGICDGLGLGDNTKGALLTRGMVEMTRLGKKMGADETTFSGLAGYGDLITTCISRHSRNRNVGELIGQGLTLEQAVAKIPMVAEGVETTRSVYALAQKLGIEMPITQEVYKTLFEGKAAKAATKDLMLRDLKPERV